MPLQPTRSTTWLDYAWSLALVAGSTGIALLGRDAFHLPDVAMLYLFAIMVAALRFGRGPAVAAAALSVATYDFFFVPPFFTFSVEHARHVLTFAMMFGLGLVVSDLAARLKHQEREARLREEHAAALSALSHELVGVPDAARAAGIAAAHAAAVFGGPAAVLIADGGRLPGPAADGGAPGIGAAELGVAQWALENGRAAGFGTEIFPQAGIVGIPLSAGLVPLGVLALSRPAPSVMDPANRNFLEAFSRQVAFAIERVRLADQARSEELRSSLLSSVSHDLRSPLAAITGAGTALRDDRGRLGPEQRADLVDTICTEAERMERLVRNVLDMVRIESGAIAVRRDWVPLEEVLGSALLRLDARLREREVRTALEDSLPLVPVDPVLLEQVFVNLLENAVRHTPAPTPLEIAARVVDRQLEIVFADRGPGLAAGDEERIFEKFRRGREAGGGGVGLGLAICRGIVEAHGGTIVAENRPGGGAAFRIRLPLGGNPPPVNLPVPEDGA